MSLTNKVAIFTLAGILLSTVAAFAFAQGGSAPRPSGSEPRQSGAQGAETPKVVAVMLYADWCGTCQIVDPRFESVKAELLNEGALFIKADKTDRDSKQAEYLFGALGFNDAWKEHGGKTGYILLVNPRTNRVVGTLTREHSESQMQTTIRRAMRG